MAATKADSFKPPAAFTSEAPVNGGATLSRIVLASASPRRLELLRSLGLDVRAVASGYDERAVAGVTPAELASLCRRLHPAVGVSASVLAHELLSRPCPPSTSPAVAVKTALGLLVGLAPVCGASLWRYERAGVMRSGARPASRTPTRARSVPRCSPMRSAMRKIMPRGASV